MASLSPSFGAQAAGPESPPPPRQAYPVQLHAASDEPLSRWLWLVTPLLLIPHCLILAAFWVGCSVGTVNAVVAIVAAGRYPRWAFDYVTGVLRWSWRVQHYGDDALAHADRRVRAAVQPDIPRGLWRLAVEFNRWVHREVGYASLLTGRYPPFRLDLGGLDVAEQPPLLHDRVSARQGITP